MRELARREPTFALHVHVGVPRPRGRRCGCATGCAAHLPLLLALSANSPFWQGRDTGLASARTPLFQAFPRVGIPRAFDDYADYVERRRPADPLRRVPRADVPVVGRAAAAALRHDRGADHGRADDGRRHRRARRAGAVASRGWRSRRATSPAAARRAPEVLDENRFLAARDGVEAELIDPRPGRGAGAELVAEVLAACAPHARELGCEAELEHLRC